MWLWVYVASILLRLAIVVVIAVGIHFAESNASSDFRPIQKTLEEVSICLLHPYVTLESHDLCQHQIQSNGFWFTLAILSVTLFGLLTPLHLYLCIVVKSLRKRMLMEIEIGFDADRQKMKGREQTVWDWLYTDRGSGLTRVHPMD